MTPTQQAGALPPITDEELSRLIEIGDLNLLQRDADAQLEATTTDAAAQFGLPVSLISIVLDSAQHFAASHGLSGWLEDAGGTPGEWAFCRFAVESKQPFIVPDATLDDRVSNNPLVTQDGVRCYLGIPLITSKGHALGTLCVLGTTPREFSEEEVAALQALADRSVAYLEARAGR